MHVTDSQYTITLDSIKSIVSKGFAEKCSNICESIGEVLDDPTLVRWQ